MTRIIQPESNNDPANYSGARTSAVEDVSSKISRLIKRAAELMTTLSPSLSLIFHVEWSRSSAAIIIEIRFRHLPPSNLQIDFGIGVLFFPASSLDGFAKYTYVFATNFECTVRFASRRELRVFFLCSLRRWCLLIRCEVEEMEWWKEGIWLGSAKNTVPSCWNWSLLVLKWLSTSFEWRLKNSGRKSRECYR